MGKATIVGISGVVAIGVLAACSAPPTTRPAATSTAFDTEDLAGATAAVNRLRSAYEHHDALATWQALTASGQSTMTRDDYAEVVHACARLFVDEPVRSIAINSTDTVATVTASAPANPGGTFTYQMIYELGRWKHQPSAGALAWMGMTAGDAITYLKLNDAC